MSRASRTWSTYIKTNVSEEAKPSRDSQALIAKRWDHTWVEKKSNRFARFRMHFYRGQNNCLQKLLLPVIFFRCVSGTHFSLRFAHLQTLFATGMARQGWRISPFSWRFLWCFIISFPMKFSFAVEMLTRKNVARVSDLLK